MSHLQTANNYPDMSAGGFIQQFALLNQTTLHIDAMDTYTANCFPINVTINTLYDYELDLPSEYMGSNYVYAISIPSTGNDHLKAYNSGLNPPDNYPVLPSPVENAACSHPLQPYFRLVLTGGADGVVIPSGINKNSKVHIVRHAEAHPDPGFRFDDGTYVAAGQWRALSLADTLAGRINPDVVYSIDSAQMWYPSGSMNVSYIRPSLTILPYVIANNLPLHLAAGFSLGSPSDPTDGTVAQDYDTIWTVSLDSQKNLTIDNELCEGIDSESLPAAAPLFWPCIQHVERDQS